MLGRRQSPGPILISRQVFVLARNRYNSGSSLYFVRGGSEIISSDAVQNGKSPEIINLLLSVIYCNLSQAGMQRLFRGEKYLPGLYADGTFRKDFFAPEQDMRPDRPKFTGCGWFLGKYHAPSTYMQQILPTLFPSSHGCSRGRWRGRRGGGICPRLRCTGDGGG